MQKISNYPKRTNTNPTTPLIHSSGCITSLQNLQLGNDRKSLRAFDPAGYRVSGTICLGKCPGKY